MPLKIWVLSWGIVGYMVQAQAAPVLLNAVAGKVGDQYITVQDAYIFRALQRLRAGTKPVLFLERDKQLAVTIQKLMAEQMIFAEARSMDYKEFNQSELARIKRNATEPVLADEWKQVLKKFQLSEQEAMSRVRNSLVAEKFLKKKMENLTPLVPEVEVDQFIKNNPEKLKNVAGDKRAFVTEAIKKEKVDKGLQDYLDFLSQKYNATYLLK